MRRIMMLVVSLWLAWLPLNVLASSVDLTNSYLMAQSKSDAWVVMALRVANQPVSAESLSIDSLNSATDVERTILGIVGGNGNPYNFRSHNLVNDLDGKRSQNQIGDVALLNDDIFGLLAYRSAGVDSSDYRIKDSRNYLINHQNNDGGWGYAINTTSDSNITAMAVTALVKTGSSANDAIITRALAYLRAIQNSDGGFGIGGGQGSDTASTAWIISAMQAAGVNPYTWVNGGHTGFDYLGQQVMVDGSYRWKSSESSGSPIMTAYAAIAVAGTSYPVATFVAPTPVLTPVPIVPTPQPVPAPVPVAPAPTLAPARVAQPSPAKPIQPLLRLRLKKQQGATVELVAEWFESDQYGWHGLSQAKIVVDGRVYRADRNGWLRLRLKIGKHQAYADAPGYVRAPVNTFVIKNRK